MAHYSSAPKRGTKRLQFVRGKLHELVISERSHVALHVAVQRVLQHMKSRVAEEYSFAPNAGFARHAERLEVEVAELADENPRRTIDRYSRRRNCPAAGLSDSSLLL
ncbi:hypothetical protein, partial [Paraburkholderia caledonica]|uniref:hypothetical protein n=1 Tax=Paraburkholderia caledonica TaxID=134536 RepID=UPI001C4FD7D0